MSTFKNIQGKNIRSYANNAPNATAGEMWYNRTEQKLKGVTASGAWSSSSNLIQQRRSLGGIGTTTAGLVYGGVDDDGTDSALNNTEEYNGSGWTTGGNLGTARNNGAPAGTQTAGLSSGGVTDTAYVTVTEEYNGTSWSEQNDMSTARTAAGGFGIQTAAVVAGGQLPPGGKSNATEEYDGSSWTGGGNMATARSTSAFGLESAGVICGGSEPTKSDKTEEYNGSSWTSSGVLPAARSSHGTSGIETAGLAFAGEAPGLVATTLDYNGTTWSVNPATLATARKGGSTGPTGTNTAAFYAGGQTPPITAITEEYNVSANTITAAAWASGGNLGTARQRAASAGASQSSALSFGGFAAPPNGPTIGDSETYNGTSWSEGNNLGTARGNTSGFGTATAAVCGPGRTPPSGTAVQNTEEYDGTSWTAGNASGTSGVYGRSTSGTLTAGLICGGFVPPASVPAEHSNNVEEYDGTNWSNGTVMPQYQAYNCQCGTQTATLNGGGNAGPNAPTVSTNAISLDYDGTNWTAGPNANILSNKFTAYNGGTGTQTSALFVGGDGTVSARFDGTTFSTDASYPAARGETNSAGSAPSTSALMYAGSPVPGVGNSTLEYSGETTSLNIVNITTS